MTTKPGICPRKSTLKTSHAQANMTTNCSERQQHAVAELTGQQSSHRHARTQHPVQRSTFCFVQERTPRAAGGEEQEHDSNRCRIKRHHLVILVLPDHIACGHGNWHAAVGIGGSSLLATALGAFAFAKFFEARFDSLLLFRRKTAGIFVQVLRSLLRHDVWHRGHGNFLKQPGDHLWRDHVAAVFQQLDRRLVRIRGAPNEIGFSPKPCGMISATGAVPAFTAASAVAAVYSGCSVPCFGSGFVLYRSDPSRSSPRTRLCEAALWSSSTTSTVILGVVSRCPPKITAKMTEEPDRQDKTQRQSSAIAAQADQCGAHNG